MPDAGPETDFETLALRLGVALAIGLLIGVERGWKERTEPEGSRTAGLRTHALLGLIGGIAAVLSLGLGGLVLGLAFICVAAAMISFEILHARAEGAFDATPLVAELLVFALGAAAGLGHVEIAGAAAVAAALILVFKRSLHTWLQRITFEELSSGLVLAAMTVIVLPLLPAEPLDPWNAVSPRNTWLLTLLVAAISFTGYAAMRIIGPKHGPMVAGVAGGLVSSSATVLSLSRLARDQKDVGAFAAGAVAANTVMFVRLGGVAAVLRPEIALPIAAAFVPAAVVGAVAVLVLLRRHRDGTVATLNLENPLGLRAAFFFGALLAAVSLAAAILNDAFGAAGTLALAAVSGLADVDAITLSMTQSTRTTATTAVLAILIAATVNTAVKTGLARVAGGRAMGGMVGASSAASLLAAAAGLAVYLAVA
jgi:uncharacterized membrane protein (DUF4010 family)